MKTYDGKNITKKHIQEIIRTQDVTRIYQLYVIITGERPDHFKVSKFCEDLAPTIKLRKWVRNNWWNVRNKHTIERNNVDNQCFRRDGGYAATPKFIKNRIVAYMKEQCQNVESKYAKRPVKGYTHLYFCSPKYGLTDYNKWRAIKIEGNERFCDLLEKYADKYFGPIKKRK